MKLSGLPPGPPAVAAGPNPVVVVVVIDVEFEDILSFRFLEACATRTLELLHFDSYFSEHHESFRPFLCSVWLNCSVPSNSQVACAVRYDGDLFIVRLTASKRVSSFWCPQSNENLCDRDQQSTTI